MIRLYPIAPQRVFERLITCDCNSEIDLQFIAACRHFALAGELEVTTICGNFWVALAGSIMLSSRMGLSIDSKFIPTSVRCCHASSVCAMLRPHLRSLLAQVPLFDAPLGVVC